MSYLVTDDGTRVLKCDMRDQCTEPITHIDEKGFIYCRHHGIARRESGYRCRQLRGFELNRIKAGNPVERY